MVVSHPTGASPLVSRWSTAAVAVLCQGRHIPALIPIFEPARAAVALQCAPKMVRANRQPKFPREIFPELVGIGALGMRLHSLQCGITQRRALRFVTERRLGLCTRRLGLCTRGFRHFCYTFLSRLFTSCAV